MVSGRRRLESHGGSWARVAACWSVLFADQVCSWCMQADNRSGCVCMNHQAVLNWK
jgi:hypothetical protein